MSPIVVGILSIPFLLTLLVLGIPIALCLGLTAIIGLLLIVGVNQTGVLAIMTSYFFISQPSLVVVPLFIFMGALAGAGGISRDIYTVLGMWVGRFRGALGVITVLSTTAFGVVTGSSMVTAAVFSKISAPEMRRQGFDKRLAYGLCAASGAIGMLIPPSVLIVVYSILAEASTGRLLIAGIVPGLMLTVGFSAQVLLLGWIKPSMVDSAGAARVHVPWPQRVASLKMLWPIFVCAGIMVGGIFGGVFSANEAAAWGALVLIIVTILTAGNRRWKVISDGMLDTITMGGMVYFIMTGAQLFAKLLMLSGITPAVLKHVIDLGLSQVAFVVMMSVIYLILGCFLDSVSMLSLTLPLVIPVVNAMRIDPIYFAMVQILSIEVGLITPPVGLNVFATKAVAEPDVTLEDIFRGSMSFFITMVVCLALIIAFPWLSTFLPKMMFK